jgi:DNA-binding NarL/FixJ family response regulator
MARALKWGYIGVPPFGGISFRCLLQYAKPQTLDAASAGDVVQNVAYETRTRLHIAAPNLIICVSGIGGQNQKISTSYKKMSVTILVVDDHKILRDGIKAILRHNPEFQVIAEAETGPAAIQICRTRRPDIVLMDIGLPTLNGIEATTEILRHNRGIKIIILSMYDDEHSVVAAIRSGARAFVLKKASESDLVDALRTVANGGSYLSPMVSDRLLQRVQRGDLASKPLPSVLDILSPRELQVLRFIAEGKTSKEIAVLLDIGLETVRSYRKTMMKKLSVTNVAGLTQLALACGITRFPFPNLASPVL